MIENVIARRYAKGLAEVAHENNELDVVRADIDRLADLVDAEAGDISVPELLDTLQSPTVPPAEKIRLTDVMCEKLSIGKTVSDFLNVLIKKNRVALTPLIAQEFRRIALSMKTSQAAVVETPYPLTEAQTKKLSAALEVATGKTIQLKTKVSPSLLGGVRVTMDHTRIDGSLRNRLERLGAQLS